MWPNPRETADLVTFTEEFLNGKLHFLCSDWNFVEISDLVLKTIYDKLHFIPYVKNGILCDPKIAARFEKT